MLASHVLFSVADYVVIHRFMMRTTQNCFDRSYGQTMSLTPPTGTKSQTQVFPSSATLCSFLLIIIILNFIKINLIFHSFISSMSKKLSDVFVCTLK